MFFAVVIDQYVFWRRIGVHKRIILLRLGRAENGLLQPASSIFPGQTVSGLQLFYQEEGSQKILDETHSAEQALCLWRMQLQVYLYHRKFFIYSQNPCFWKWLAGNN